MILRFLLITLSFFALGCNNNSSDKLKQEQSNIPRSPGKINNGLYTNEYLHWSLKVPSGWEITPNELLERWDSIGVAETGSPNLDKDQIHLISFHKPNDKFTGFMSSIDPQSEYPSFKTELNYLKAGEKQLLPVIKKQFNTTPAFKYGTVNIDGLTFQTQEIHYANVNQLILLKFIRGEMLLCAISWKFEEDKKIMLESIQNSKFEKKL